MKMIREIGSTLLAICLIYGLVKGIQYLVLVAVAVIVIGTILYITKSRKVGE